MRLPFLLLLSLSAVVAQTPPAPGTGIAGAVTGTAAIEFSQMKVLQQPPAPPYPPLAKIARIQGTVVVEIIVGPDGIPTQARALEGPPQLRPAAEAYAMAWKFVPYLVGGQPVACRFKLTMPFRLRDGMPPLPAQAVITFDLDAPSVILDAAFLRETALSGLSKYHFSPVTPAQADPAKASSITLVLKVTRHAPDWLLCEASLRSSLLKDQGAAPNAVPANPTQAPLVEVQHSSCAQRGEVGLTGTLIFLMNQVIARQFNPDVRLVLAGGLKTMGNPVSSKNTNQLPSVRKAPPALVCAPEVLAKFGPGRVSVNVLVDEMGRPVRAELLTGPAELEAAALAYVFEVDYEPARIQGVPQKGQVRLEVPFVSK